MVCTSAGDDPKDTNHTLLKTMFELIKANKKGTSSIPEVLKKEGLHIGNKSAAKYFKEVGQKGLFTLDPRSLEPSFEKIQTVFDESDAEQFDERAHHSGIMIGENIQGTLVNDTITVNARNPWGIHQHVDYWTVVEAKGGNDTIVNAHQHEEGTLTQHVRVVGGKGIDSFVALTGGVESDLSILDMEAGETITTAAEFNVATRLWGNTYGVRNAEGDDKIRTAQLPENHTLQHLYDQSGNNVFICVPEF